ncbi:hypothetical protein [Fluviicola sp.]|uniref:hypothetical protein n=1 Tax=Fluviicola sp. TaxID=1917219 RepID=UPI0031E027C5
MKHTISFLLIALLFACNSTETPKVKTLKQILVFESRFELGKELEPRLVEREVYNEKGLLISQVAYEESGTVDYRSELVYDAKGRKIKDTYFLGNKCHSISEFLYKPNDSLHIIVVYQPDMKLDFTIQPLYDKKGFNYRDVCRETDHKLRFWDTYERYKSGRLKKWTRFNPDSTVQSKAIYYYDRKGREIKNVCSGELGGTYLHKYSKKGLVTEEIGYNTLDHSFLWLKVFRYDKSDNLVKIIEYDSLKDRPKNPWRVRYYKYEFWEP